VSEPLWLDAPLVRAIHAELLAEHGGLDARVDVALLESALARPRQRFAYADALPSLAELAASYGFGLAKNHCFSDGNKRIALAAIDVLLQLNGRELFAPETEAVFMIEDLAAGRLGESVLAAWIAQGERVLGE
jgi:death-on-curing protein